jgi:hypothetical protein
MTISDIVRRDYIVAIEVAENMAQRFPPDSREGSRWRLVAETYRRALADPVGEFGHARLKKPAPQEVFES